MRIPRLFTRAGESPYKGIAFKSLDIDICHADPEQRCCIADLQVPAHWSVEAAELLAQNYLLKSSVPLCLKAVDEPMVPHWLQRRVADESLLSALPKSERYGAETAAKDAFHRIAGAWTYWGFKRGYFDTESDARAFYDETCYMLAMQMCAPSSPIWFNTGLHWAYGIDGHAQGHFYIDSDTNGSGNCIKSNSAYAHPQHHAAFIQGVKDELVNEGGIMHLWEREARVFKYGSGTGSNFSAIRGAGEHLSGGAASWGLMPFLATGDKAAGAIQSGGRARRAGKMVMVDIDHPDVTSFIGWKMEEEHKAASLMAGSRLMRKHLTRIMEAIQSEQGGQRFDVKTNLKLKHAVRQARHAMIPASYIERIIDYARQGFTEVVLPVYGAEEQQDVFMSVSAHQGRLCLRVSDAFLDAVAQSQPWRLRKRVDDSIASTLQAEEVWETIAQASWACGEPGMQFDDTINAWNTCSDTGRIRASNPGGEFLFLDDTACALASLNIMAFQHHKGLHVEGFEHAVRLLTVALDITTEMAQYPSRSLARNTHDFRPIGLGYANLGAWLMANGIAYDSREGYANAAAITALMSGAAYAASAELAQDLGAFPAHSANRDAMARVLHNHREAATGQGAFEGIAVPPPVLYADEVKDEALADAVRRNWDLAIMRGAEFGYRNAQVTALAPTLTIGRVMDCDSLSLAPQNSLMQYRRDEDGHYRKNPSAHVPMALGKLGYSPAEVMDILTHLLGRGTLEGCPELNYDHLRERGFGDAQIERIEEALEDTLDIRNAFDPWVLGEGFCRDVLGLNDDEVYDASFDMLAHMGFSQSAIDEANRYACGARTMLGAPHVAAEHVAVFACGNAESEDENQVGAVAQLRLMAAVQPFLSGGMAHSITLAHDAPIAECRYLYEQAWQLGLKGLSVRRAQSGLHCQSLSFELDDAEEEEAELRVVKLNPQRTAEALVKQVVSQRRELPLRRGGFTQKAVVGGSKLYLRTGEYRDGELGEIFIDLPKEAPGFRAMVNQFATAISIALQYGVPLESFVAAFTDSQFSPSGEVEGSPAVQSASSVLDYVFRELAGTYMEDEGRSVPTLEPIATMDDLMEEDAADAADWAEREAAE